MAEIRIGLVGLGHRGLWWLRILQKMEGYRIVAICDPIVPLHETALAVLDNRDDVAVYERYEDMLADDRVEAVAVTVRSLDQGALAAQALEAGKHVNCEVPAAHRMADCWRIVLAVERGNVVYQLGEQTRYFGFIDAWRDEVQSGRLGRVTYCEGQYIGYYGTRQFFQNPETGQFSTIEELPSHPNAEPTVLHRMPPIHYLPHELSPMLKVLDDRVVEVTAMCTRSPSYSHPEIAQPDISVALMRTEKDALLRMVTGFTQPVPHHDHHWYQVIATRGRLEWRRTPEEQPRMWRADAQMHGFAAMDWRYERTDAPPEASASGHGDADYYVHANFRDVLLGDRPLDIDVYHAMDTAAPAILAADSIDEGTVLKHVPDFRPNASRRAGEAPKEG